MMSWTNAQRRKVGQVLRYAPGILEGASLVDITLESWEPQTRTAVVVVGGVQRWSVQQGGLCERLDDVAGGGGAPDLAARLDEDASSIGNDEADILALALSTSRAEATRRAIRLALIVKGEMA